MCASNKGRFYSCYCCYWATAKSTWTFLTYETNKEKKKKEREGKYSDSQTQSAGERRKRMIGCDLTGIEKETEREETMRDREEQRQEKQATTKGVFSQCEEQLENKER